MKSSNPPRDVVLSKPSQDSTPTHQKVNGGVDELPMGEGRKIGNQRLDVLNE